MNTYYTRHAARDLKSLSSDTQKRSATKMRFFTSQSDPLNFAETLTDRREGNYRFRIGDYRVIFDVVDSKIYVLKIKRRDEAYQ